MAGVETCTMCGCVTDGHFGRDDEENIPICFECYMMYTTEEILEHERMKGDERC